MPVLLDVTLLGSRSKRMLMLKEFDLIMEESTPVNPFRIYAVSLALYTKLLHPTLQNIMGSPSDIIELFKKEL